MRRSGRRFAPRISRSCRRRSRAAIWCSGGALANPIDGTVLLFKGSSPAAAETFAKGDPYVTNGLVTKWRVREWTTVVGDLAENLLPRT